MPWQAQGQRELELQERDGVGTAIGGLAQFSEKENEDKPWLTFRKVLSFVCSAEVSLFAKQCMTWLSCGNKMTPHS